MVTKIMVRALAWAKECGMVESSIEVENPRPEYYGWTVIVKDEKDGKRRQATARFTLDGKPSMWEMSIR